MRHLVLVFALLLWGPAVIGCDDDESEGTDGDGTGENTVVLCQDGQDNDGDGAVDSADPECAALQTDTATDTGPSTDWITSWVSAQQITEPDNKPPETPGLANNTLRQVIHPSVGGEQLRIELSNAYGNGPLAITSAGMSTPGVEMPIRWRSTTWPAASFSSTVLGVSATVKRSDSRCTSNSMAWPPESAISRLMSPQTFTGVPLTATSF